MKIVTRALFVLIMLVVCGVAPVEPSDARDPEWWHEYVGDLEGGLKIGMTLRFRPDGRSAFGTYYYAKHCKDLRIEVELDGRDIVIREFDPSDECTGVFRGAFARVDPRKHYQTKDDLVREVIVGTWTKPDGSAKRAFYLNLIHATHGSNRYAGAGFERDQEVDAFAARFRSAVIGKDSGRVADMIGFPISVHVGDARGAARSGRLEIRDRATFLRRYDEIVHAAYVQRIENAVPFHMFVNYQGVMLGDGEVWFGRTESGRVRVIALNNGSR